MTLQSFSFWLLASLLIVFNSSSCASLTGYQTGRTVGENTGLVAGSLNFSHFPDIAGDLFDDDNGSDSLSLGDIAFPNAELLFRYGVIEKLDFGFKANTNLNMVLDGKYQLVGDQESLFACSAGLGVGTIAFLFWNVEVPLYLSVHPTEKLHFYASPKFIYQSLVDAGSIGSINYLGGNAGVLFGRQFKFGLDVGYYDVNYSSKITASDGDIYKAVSFGLGLSYTFGDSVDKKKD